jgi:hypothetical protein
LRKSLWMIPSVLLFAAVVAPAGLRADDIQYTLVNFSLPLGSVGSVSGTITTDGTLGSINAANIVNWNIIDTSSSTSLDLTPSNSTVVTVAPDGLTATSTTLTMDFPAAVAGGLGFTLNLADSGEVTFSAGGGGLGLYGYIVANATDDSSSDEAYEYFSTSQVIAADGTAVSTPEPGTSSLMLVGMGLLGLVMVRRKHMGTVNAAWRNLKMRKTSWIIPALLLSMSAVTPAAHADTVTKWTLSGVTFSDGYSAAGSFDYDATTGTATNVDITINDPNNLIFDAADIISAGDDASGNFYIDATTGDLSLDISGCVCSVPPPASLVILASGTFFNDAGAGGYGGGVNPDVAAGDIASTVLPSVTAPEPGSFSLTLIGLGLLGLVFVTQWRVAAGHSQAV